jgi:hypothetical protein
VIQEALHLKDSSTVPVNVPVLQRRLHASTNNSRGLGCRWEAPSTALYCGGTMGETGRVHEYE